MEGDFVKPIPVRIIATDGTMTEVRGKDLYEGMQVAIGESVVSEADSDATNPFMPRLSSALSLRSGSCGGEIGTGIEGKRNNFRLTEDAIMELIRRENITKTYHLGEVDVPVRSRASRRPSIAAKWWP